MPTSLEKEIRSGSRVMIIEKHNQRTGQLTEGIVVHILTKSPSHPHDIKVRLADGKLEECSRSVEKNIK